MFLSGFGAVACMQRSIRNLGDRSTSSKGGRSSQLAEGIPMGGQESDPLIVLRGGRTGHMGKRWAGWLPEQSTRPDEYDCLVSKLAFDTVSRALFKLSLRDHPEEPFAVVPHAGIWEGAARRRAVLPLCLGVGRQPCLRR